MAPQSLNSIAQILVLIERSLRKLMSYLYFRILE